MALAIILSPTSKSDKSSSSDPWRSILLTFASTRSKLSGTLFSGAIVDLTLNRFRMGYIEPRVFYVGNQSR
ncbi:hypothetical protein LEP1GSC193_0140 [Leptospira alstonii serovar Pingchang str. 80-412]|uniref:Uncharacterized protein n=2 Tax=Leptospira alstonii TaxID=28452 RepID=M6CX99_9LEPT|nr:hypothetical protein LEP1GSC194_2703 [Leptospira alstonii serovar Sichuan str. 79601]EQA82211.1 hypothetical protein LEP1GSC193_0140 [Leptospira alstonii serovar Pingchang str. 80-412]